MHLDSVNDEPAQREAIGEMLPEVVAFSSSVPLNPRLWTVLKAAASCDWVKDLSPSGSVSSRKRWRISVRAGRTCRTT